MKIFPTKAQFKKWTLPSKIGVIAGYLTVIGFLLTIISYFTPNTIIYNYYNHTEVTQASENAESQDKKLISNKELNKETSSIVYYSLIGNNNFKLIEEIEGNGKIIIDSNSENKISFSSSTTILVYGDISNNMFKSTRGSLIVEVNRCAIPLNQCIIPSFGPAPKEIIQNEINNKIDKFIEENIKLISQTVYRCIN